MIQEERRNIPCIHTCSSDCPPRRGSVYSRALKPAVFHSEWLGRPGSIDECVSEPRDGHRGHAAMGEATGDARRRSRRIFVLLVPTHISRGLYVGRWHCIDRKRVHLCADLCHIHGHIVRYECNHAWTLHSTAASQVQYAMLLCICAGCGLPPRAAPDRRSIVKVV